MKTNNIFKIEYIFFTLLLTQIILQIFTLNYKGGEPFIFVFFSMLGGLALTLIPGLLSSAVIYFIRKRKKAFSDIFLNITSFILFFVIGLMLIDLLS